MSDLSKRLSEAVAGLQPPVRGCSLANTYRDLPDDEDRGTVRGVIFSDKAATEVVACLALVGLDVSPRSIRVHRRGQCQSCQRSGVWHE